MIIHDRVIYFAREYEIIDDYGVIQGIEYETKGLATLVNTKLRGLHHLAIEQEDHGTIVDGNFNGPFQGYVVAEYSKRPKYNAVGYLGVIDIPYGTVRLLPVDNVNPWLIVLQGKVTCTLTLVERETLKEHIFNPIDINNDGKGFRAIFVISDRLRPEPLEIEHNCDSCKAYKLAMNYKDALYRVKITLEYIG